MAACDAATIAAGVPGTLLMERAGRAVARAVVARFARRPVLVLCGPGNNGGDGYVAARHLRDAGWPVRLASLAPVARLRGDAAWAAKRWTGPVEDLAGPGSVAGELTIDALFGAGLARPLEGRARAVVEALGSRRPPTVAVDVPSGIDGATGEVRGAAIEADVTVTFCRLKPGHLLQPGRRHAGEIVLAEIGIPDRIVHEQESGLRANTPPLWLPALPRRGPQSHKYRHGSALVMGGPAHQSGAARLAARAALRAGAGLVSVACTTEALDVYAGRLTAVMTKCIADDAALDALLADGRLSGFLIGPGYGVGEATAARCARLLATGRPVVLDADALTSHQGRLDALVRALHPACVLTPHDGEYARLFPFQGDRLSRARQAAARAGCVMLLKGADTVVAAPDGRAAIATLAAPWLATAGSGDVLAGLVLGFVAQGMPAFEAAAAAVWLHAAAAARHGPGLIAEDLSELLPGLLGELVALRHHSRRNGGPAG
ncbi:MAG TPA: NAD(P)H-hydrate dehydratase [Geminicoccaceae bacterium]|nr:NAD(P)H-hydrate dehydratase [Geminicoccaceae bacterium]